MTAHPDTSDPPRISYRRIQEEGSRGEEPGRTGDKARPYVDAIQWGFTALTWLVLFFVLLVWAVVGAVFWIPLILRATLRFSLSLLETVFEGHKPAKAAKALRDAVSFYRRGFVVAVEVITGEKIDERDDGPVTEKRLFKEILWAVLVWYFIALFFGWIQASPLDLVDWFRAIPWGEYFGDLVDRFRGLGA